MLYLDNAATSYPKLEAVYLAADKAFRDFSGNPGRSGYALSLAAGRAVEDTRLALARLFHAPDPENIVFTLNATDALNLAIKGILVRGGHAVTTSMEHNSVIRPLEALVARGVTYTKVAMDPVTGVLVEGIAAAIRPDTRLVVITQVSNVTGTANPIAEIGALCRERGVSLLVDAAQSAGLYPIDVLAANIDLLAFPGHKGLLGPQGTGGLYIAPSVNPEPLRYGGTGTRSELRVQPAERPSCYESGTHNVAGIAALGEGVRFLLDRGIAAVTAHEAALANRFIEGLSRIRGVTLYGPGTAPNRSAVVSFTADGIDPAALALVLDNSFGIAVRAGLHCAPDAHETIGTLDTGGTVRVSPGWNNLMDDIERCIEAVRTIAEGIGGD